MPNFGPKIESYFWTLPEDVVANRLGRYLEPALASRLKYAL